MSVVSIRPLRHSPVKAFAVAAALVGAVLAWPQAGVARHHEGAFARVRWRMARRRPGSCRPAAGRRRSTAARAVTYPKAAKPLARPRLRQRQPRFDIRTSAVAEGGNVSGTWQETTRGVGGNLSGQIEGGAFEGSVQGPGFTASVSYRSNGRTQTVVISPNNAGGIARVEASLGRG